MRVRVQPEAAADLLQFLRRADCRAQLVDDQTVEVEVPAAFGTEQARMEVDLYLKAWQAAHPGAEAQLVDPQTRVEDAPTTAD